MISLDVFVARSGLDRGELESWIERAWLRPEGAPGRYVFRDIDLARARLITELREEMRIDEEAMPVVLSLLDQLYAARRHMRLMCDALERAAPDEVRLRVLQLLAGRGEE